MKTKRTIKRRAVRAATVALAAGAGLGLQAAQPSPEIVPANPPAGAPHSIGSRGFSAMPLAPHVVQAMRQQGKTIEDPAPSSANRGKKFNPQGELIGPLTIDPVQEVLVIFVEFTTLPPGGPATRLDLKYFDDLLFGTRYDPPEYAAYPGHPTDRTLRNYYKEASYGKLDVVTLNLSSKIGWVQAGRPYEYYCRADGVHDNGGAPYPENVQGLVIDAIKAVDSKVAGLKGS